jgi:drug/metabolite transporter (DMT)-like permease
MMNTQKSIGPKVIWVVVAFAIVYVVWGSTYFFIQMAIKGIPPMMMGAIRFSVAGILLLAWCAFKGDRLWLKKDIITSGITGLLLLFVSTGIVIWAEQSLPSALVAIMVSANPIWFAVLDSANRKSIFKDKMTIIGIIIGFLGVILLFSEAISTSLSGAMGHNSFIALLMLFAAPVVWAMGSLYSKKRTRSLTSRVGTAWQMLIAGLAFTLASVFRSEYHTFHFNTVPLSSWLALGYLVVFGSIAAFSAYVWLLSVRPVTQVSTHSYVNPLIAVLLAFLFAGEHISLVQIFGLLVILVSVLLINLKNYSFGKRTCSDPDQKAKGGSKQKHKGLNIEMFKPIIMIYK